MRIFTVSDLHIDYEENRHWLHQLSFYDHQDDILILAGDISDKTMLLMEAFEVVQRRFATVLYVPGNHDLWVKRNGGDSSLEQFLLVRQIADDYGLKTEPVHAGSISIVPLFGWYDYSFGQPSQKILDAWVDFAACKWPSDFDETAITNFFVSLNEPVLQVTNQTVITFSHFLPRIDVMPWQIPAQFHYLYPVLGTTRLETQLRTLNSSTHIYGHSHVNRYTTIDEVVYINNAFGYPRETRTRKELFYIMDTTD